jgi:hypothetical protein
MDSSSRIPHSVTEPAKAWQAATRSQALAAGNTKTVVVLVPVINECIKRLTAAKMWETAELLRIARLDLVARANGISEDELELFTFALQKACVRDHH